MRRPAGPVAHPTAASQLEPYKPTVNAAAASALQHPSLATRLATLPPRNASAAAAGGAAHQKGPAWTLTQSY